MIRQYVFIEFNISGYEYLIGVDVQKDIPFETKLVAKENGFSGSAGEFGSVVLECGYITEGSKDFYVIEVR